MHDERMGYVSVIQVGHIIRGFNREHKIIDIKSGNEIDKESAFTKLAYQFGRCMKVLGKFQILDFDSKSQYIYNELRSLECRMEDHDIMNVAIAIANKLDIDVIDKDLEADLPHIKKVAKVYGFNIRVNGK